MLLIVTVQNSSSAAVSPLAGVAVPAEVFHGKTAFEEALLFTHRGLSGPSILQISSYWREGDAVRLKLEPHRDIAALLKQAKQKNGRQSPQTALSEILPKRLARSWRAKCRTGRSSPPVRKVIARRKSRSAALIRPVSIPAAWRRNPYPASISSANVSM